MKRFLFAFALLAIGALGWFFLFPKQNEPYPKVFVIEGSTEQRIAKATEILSEYCKPPGPLLDAQLAEEIFDNGFAPSDSHIYGVLTVPTTDLHKWRELLATGSTDASASATNLRPASAPAWWPADESLESAEFFHARSLIGRTVGWAAVSTTGSTITLFAFDP